jgi:hypothetical protein
MIMTSFSNGLSAGNTGNTPAAMKTNGNLTVQAAQEASKNAIEFQLWTSQQATSLAKLKIFSTMAKSVNDQQ